MRLEINQETRDLEVEPGTTLAVALRAGCGLHSPHLGCEDGTCGACTVLVEGEATRSCLMLAAQCGGARVVTLEGLRADHPAHDVDRTAHCPDCVPGLIMLAARYPALDPAVNVCRHSGVQRPPRHQEDVGHRPVQRLA